MREKTVKLGAKQYQMLTGMLHGTRQRAQVIEGLIEVLEKSFTEDKHFIYDVMTDPASLKLVRKNK